MNDNAIILYVIPINQFTLHFFVSKDTSCYIHPLLKGSHRRHVIQYSLS